MIVDNVQLLNLVVASAPEKEKDLRTYWTNYQPTVQDTIDQTGFCFKAIYDHIFINKRAILQFWLLIHAAYRSIYLYGDFVFAPCHKGDCVSDSILDKIPGQNEEDLKFAKIVALADSLSRLENVETFEWPSYLYNPVSGVPTSAHKEIWGNEVTAIYDISCIALAFVFLHEVKHVIDFSQKGSGPKSIKEELECDYFGISILITNINEYCKKNNCKIEDVLFKRGCAIAAAFFVMAFIAGEENRNGTETHPSIKARIEPLLTTLNLPDTSYFWIFTSCLMMAFLKQLYKQTFTVTLDCPKSVCFQLLSLI